MSEPEQNAPVGPALPQVPMLTSSTPWTEGDLSAQLSMFSRRRSARKVNYLLKLSVGDDVAWGNLEDLADLATAASRSNGVVESVRVDGKGWFIALGSAADPTSFAADAMSGVGPDDVAFLAEHDKNVLLRIATISLSQLSDLIDWGQRAADLEQHAQQKMASTTDPANPDKRLRARSGSRSGPAKDVMLRVGRWELVRKAVIWVASSLTVMIVCIALDNNVLKTMVFAAVELAVVVGAVAALEVLTHLHPQMRMLVILRAVLRVLLKGAVLVPWIYISKIEILGHNWFFAGAWFAAGMLGLNLTSLFLTGKRRPTAGISGVVKV